MFAATSFAQLVCESLTRAFTKRDEVIGKLTDFAAFFFICTEHRSKPISALKRVISKLKGEYLLGRFVLPCSKIWSLFRQNLLSKLLPCYRNTSIVNDGDHKKSAGGSLQLEAFVCSQNNNPNVSKNGFSILEKEFHGLTCACIGFLFAEVKNLPEVIIRVG